MSREEMLDIIMLLSALESWGFSVKEHIPDYLHERLTDAIDVLRAEVLKGTT
jgi:hypothetical protein